MQLSSSSQARALRFLQQASQEHQSVTKPPPYARYADDPVGFFRDVLGFEPWAGKDGKPGQIDVVRALPQYKTIAVRSGHKIGKTKLAAGLAWWWYSTRESARAILTAPTGRQIKSAIWREIRSLKRKAKRPLDGTPALDPGTGIQSDDEREILGFSTNDPDRFSGFSSPNILYIVDEASGVDELIFDALEGNRAGGAWLLMLGNPTKTSGKFYRAFTAEKLFVHTVHISSEDTPQNIPGLAVKAWVDERAKVWGRDSALYQVRVLGNFADEAENVVIPLFLVDRAKQAWRDMESARGGRTKVGVDVARFGDDDTVMQGVIGNRTLLPRIPRKPARSEMSAEQLNAWLAREVLQYTLELHATNPNKNQKPLVCVDGVGVGAAVWGVLSNDKRIECVMVETGAAPTGSVDDGHKEKSAGGKVENADRYFNLRSQIHFGLKAWLLDGGGIHDDPMLEQELTAPTFEFDARNRYKVERKEDIKPRLGRSPDRMDALCLAVYQPPPTQEFRADKSARKFYL